MSEPSAAAMNEAKKVLQAFVDAGARHDNAVMKTLVTRRTLEGGKLDANASPDGVRFVMGDAKAEGESVVIPLSAYPEGAPADSPPLFAMPCIMVQEDGQWKFELGDSVERMMGGLLDATVGPLAAAMEGVGKAMADGLGEAFKGLGEALGGEAPTAIEPAQSWDDVSLSPTEEEFLPPLDVKTLPKTQAAVSEAVGSPVIVEAALKDILQRAGSDETDVIFNWFEDQLFAGWAALLAELGKHMPLKDRLRAIRIEPATRVETRLLALDGSDLVYRLQLPHDQGFYQDEELGDLLPPVLAGLPETIDPASAGRRLLPLDEELPSIELYRRQAAPRFMRRISDLVGHHVALDINWEDFEPLPHAGKLLATWGLNRVLGGIAIDRMDPSHPQRCSREVKRVSIFLADHGAESSVCYDDGALLLGLRCYTEFDRGSYEGEIAVALAGRPADSTSPSE